MHDRPLDLTVPPTEPGDPAWLVRGEVVLASLEIAADRRSRTRGLLGRDGIDGALLLRPARSVHTFGMHFAIDVAYVDAHLRVLRLSTVAPNRLPRPQLRGRAVLEAEAGAFARWGLRVGDELEVRSCPAR